MDLNLTKYDHYRKWMRECRERKISWDSITYGKGSCEDDLQDFLGYQKKYNFWEISKEEWLSLVASEKVAEERNYDLIPEKSSIIVDVESTGTIEASKNPGSCWVRYKKKLIKKNFNESSIKNIEVSSLKILSQLKITTERAKPVKGLVVGQVQSGKTANMAGLIALSADYGWNMFIVLSGTIENLREQTSERLFKDLKDENCNINFTMLNDLSHKSKLGSRSQDLNLNKDKEKYLYVCLKNKTRLMNLNKWLNKDQKSKQHLKILIIDDEADQAGINTLDIDEDSRRAINQQIVNIVFDKDHENNTTKEKFQCVNYVGYTATPYANILNESSESSLYPHSFILTLGTSNEYFGPQQIFGVDGTHYNGLSIVNTITNIKHIENIHLGRKELLPSSLIEAINWFICCIAISRLWGRKDPVSMLIHTSQRQDHHEKLANKVSEYISGTPINKLLKNCEKTFKCQTRQFNLKILRDQYPQYEIMNDQINEYPSYREIKDEIQHILTTNLTNIFLNDEGEFVYSQGIHLCIDNCKNNTMQDDGAYLRLVYPKKENCDIISPAFIVIGGATLSRGLTIEGLVSSYFLRTVKQADTLMQMGRWFGYRRGYELLPRIWLTAQTFKQFKFLSLLDYELRKEIYSMEANGISPSEYGPKVLMHPKASFIMVTNRKRMQAAEKVDIDYTGTSHQTVVFYEDPRKLRANLKNTVKFVNKLGQDQNKNPYAKNCKVFRNINSLEVTKYLSSLEYPKESYVFSNIDSLIEWINTMVEKEQIKSWNVILGGVLDGEEFKFDNVSINKVSRSQRLASVETGTFNIGVLRAPEDEFADLDIINANEEQIQLFKDRKNNNEDIRAHFKLEFTPQLFIYIIDKNSKASTSIENSKRQDLNVTEDVVGVWIHIPRGDKQKKYNAKLRIKLRKNMEKGDIIE